MPHVVTIRIELTDQEFRIVGRAAAGMINHLEGRAIHWDLSVELVALLRRAIRSEGLAQATRDNIAALLARQVAAPLAPPAPAPVPLPEWLREVGSDDPMTAFPADLADDLKRIREGGQG